MTFQEAARMQYRYHSYYTVWLVAPDGTRTEFGLTQRKSGSGLMAILRSDAGQKRIAGIPGVAAVTFKKTATALILSNGYKIAFGGTIRQEASELLSGSCD